MRFKEEWHINRARQLRGQATKPERLLWSVLRPSRCASPCFRRRHPFGENYIVDFCCLEAKVVIEVDGEIHDWKVEEDRERQAYIERQGFEVVRVEAKAVLKDYKVVAGNIINHCRAKLGLELLEVW